MVVATASGCAGRRLPESAADLRPGLSERGLASWYGEEFAGLPTANGEIFRPDAISAAHRTLPLGSVIDVTNERNWRTVRVRVNDRGPFVGGRIVDLSRAAAAAIGSVEDGVVPVTLVVVSVGNGERVRPARNGAEERPGSGWTIQVGSFASEENAIRLRDRLAKASYPDPYLEKAGGLTRVKFGAFRSRLEAEKALGTLSELGLAGIAVPRD